MRIDYDRIPALHAAARRERARALDQLLFNPLKEMFRAARSHIAHQGKARRAAA